MVDSRLLGTREGVKVDGYRTQKSMQNLNHQTLAGARSRFGMYMKY